MQTGFGGSLWLVFFKLYFRVRRADPLPGHTTFKVWVEDVWRRGDETVCVLTG